MLIFYRHYRPLSASAFVLPNLFRIHSFAKNVTSGSTAKIPLLCIAFRVRRLQLPMTNFSLFFSTFSGNNFNFRCQYSWHTKFIRDSRTLAIATAFVIAKSNFFRSSSIPKNYGEKWLVCTVTRYYALSTNERKTKIVSAFLPLEKWVEYVY